MAHNHSSPVINATSAWEGDEHPSHIAAYAPDIHAEVDRRLGLFDNEEMMGVEAREQRLRDAIDALGPIWDFCFENGKGKLVTEHTPETLQLVLRRFAVLTLMFRPSLMPHEKLRSLGPKLNVSRVPVSKIGIEASKRFNVHTRVQKPKSSIQNYADAAKKGHKKRKLRQKASVKKKITVARKPSKR